MNRKDTIIITFFILIFVIVLYQKKLSGKGTAGSGTGGEGQSTSEVSGSQYGSGSAGPSSGSEARELDDKFAELVEAFAPSGKNNPKKGIPPAGLQTKSFYDEKGNFKSYYDGKLPDEFLTKLEYFTDPHKMQDDIYYKKSKMFWHQDAEREEFKKFHDWRGKDRKKYQELLDMHAKARHEADQKNHETWKQLKRDYYQYDSELR